VWFRKNPVPSLSRPVKLTRREVVALLLGFKILRDGIAPPFDWAADQVIREVLRAAGRDARAAVQELESRVSMGSRHDLSWDTFYELSRAVCERRRVRITYYTRSRDTIGERTVRPYVLACSLGRWYLVGHCEWRDEVRTFRLDRIRTAALMDDGFVPPTTFNPSAHLGSGIYPTHGPGGQHRVVIDLEPFFAAQQGFVVDAPAGDGDGLCSVAFDVPEERFEGFLSWLVSMTTRFRIVSPPSLASRFDERRRRILAAYESVLD
jgi:predicted DNA-binding transcriptional regulator YafY